MAPKRNHKKVILIFNIFQYDYIICAIFVNFICMMMHVFFFFCSNFDGHFYFWAFLFCPLVLWPRPSWRSATKPRGTMKFAALWDGNKHNKSTTRPKRSVELDATETGGFLPKHKTSMGQNMYIRYIYIYIHIQIYIYIICTHGQCKHTKRHERRELVDQQLMVEMSSF